MEQSKLNELSRISDVIRNLSASAQKEPESRLHSYKDYYVSNYELVHPILIDDMLYQRQFLALKRPNQTSWSEIRPALIQLSTFVDGVIKQETLGNRQQKEEFFNEYFIEEGKPLSAYSKVTSIINSAVSTLKLVDNYADASTLDFFLAVNTQASISLLTMKCLPNKPAFLTAKSKFVTQWGGYNFEVKETNYFHDRFIIIDNTQVWHLGPSLNNLGKKPMMISMIRDDDVIKTIIDTFDKQWSIATTL